MSVDYEKEPLEIIKGGILFSLPNDATKETVRIQFIGEQKVMTWQEYTDAIRKIEKKKAKAKITSQLEKEIAEKKESEVSDGDDNEPEEEEKEEE